MKSQLQRIAAVAVMMVLLVAGLAFAQGKVDVNQADVKGLMSLKGIGEQKAKAIVKYRQMHGPFQSPDDLSNVPGIGKKIVTNNKGMIVIGKGGPAAKPGKPKAKNAYQDATKPGKKAMPNATDKANKAMAGAKDKAKKAMTDAMEKGKKAKPNKQ